MGYRSDVLIAAAFETKEFMDDVLAVYRMHSLVRQHNMSVSWVQRDRQEGDPYCLVLNMQDVKWYPDYEEVQAAEHMEELIRMFGEERAAACGYVHIRVGEDLDDNEYDKETFNDDDDFAIERFFINNFGIRREIYQS